MFLYDFVNVKLIGKKKSRSDRNDSFLWIEVVYFCTFTSKVILLSSS